PFGVKLRGGALLLTIWTGMPRPFGAAMAWGALSEWANGAPRGETITGIPLIVPTPAYRLSGFPVRGRLHHARHSAPAWPGRSGAFRCPPPSSDLRAARDGPQGQVSVGQAGSRHISFHCVPASPRSCPWCPQPRAGTSVAPPAPWPAP